MQGVLVVQHGSRCPPLAIAAGGWASAQCPGPAFEVAAALAELNGLKLFGRSLRQLSPAHGVGGGIIQRLPQAPRP